MERRRADDPAASAARSPPLHTRQPPRCRCPLPDRGLVAERTCWAPRPQPSRRPPVWRGWNRDATSASAARRRRPHQSQRGICIAGVPRPWRAAPPPPYCCACPTVRRSAPPIRDLLSSGPSSGHVHRREGPPPPLRCRGGGHPPLLPQATPASPLCRVCREKAHLAGGEGGAPTAPPSAASSHHCSRRSGPAPCGSAARVCRSGGRSPPPSR